MGGNVIARGMTQPRVHRLLIAFVRRHRVRESETELDIDARLLADLSQSTRLECLVTVNMSLGDSPTIVVRELLDEKQLQLPVIEAPNDASTGRRPLVCNVLASQGTYCIPADGGLTQMAKVGLIGMSAKPWHAGHDGLVRLAASENDRVVVFVSTSDRTRKGELTIFGSDMEELWHATIEPNLPKNVNVVYCHGASPITKVWETLGNANENGSHDTLSLYADPEDIASAYTENNLRKYCGNLFSGGQIILRAVKRSSTVDVSGTAMRQYLEKGDKESFIKYLPDGVDKDLVWNTLYASSKKAPSVKKASQPRKFAKSEGLIHDYVKLLLDKG